MLFQPGESLSTVAQQNICWKDSLASQADARLEKEPLAALSKMSRRVDNGYCMHMRWRAGEKLHGTRLINRNRRSMRADGSDERPATSRVEDTKWLLVPESYEANSPML